MGDLGTESTANACAHDDTRCAATGRREFLIEALRAGAVALAAIGLTPAGADAMPTRFVSAAAGLSRKDVTYPAPTADGVQIDKGNEVILARVGKQVFAFVLACPHQNTALRWEGDDQRFQCPKHKSKYRPDGTFIEGRATRGMDRYAVKLVGASVVVDLDTVYQEDMDKSAWQQAVVTLS